MKNLFVFTLTVFLAFSCKNTTKEKEPVDEQSTEMSESQPEVSLKELWSTDTTFLTPESALYDKGRDIIYVSNVNMNPWEKDGNGFLSKIDTKGNIVELEWVSGFDGPKGMGIVDNKLFVADIDKLVEINIETGEIITKYPFEEGSTLNDITIGDDGTVYISSSATDKVFSFKDGEISVVIEGELGRPNGLFFEPGKLFMLTSGSAALVNIDLATKETETLAEGFGHGDGLMPVGSGDYLATSWQGEIFYVSPDWHVTQLLDTREQEINTADIDYIIEKNILLVPTFFDNRVVAYSLNK